MQIAEELNVAGKRMSDSTQTTKKPSIRIDHEQHKNFALNSRHEQSYTERGAHATHNIEGNRSGTLQDSE